MIVIALLLIPGLTFAQEGTIAGTVVDSTTSEPLPGVNVVVQGLNTGAATGANGQYEISGVPVGEQTLVASYVGYTEKRVSVDVKAGATTTVNIRMAPEAVGLEDVVVTALGRERSERAVATSVQEVGGAELDRAEKSNFISTLEGKVAGASIRSSNKMGGSSNIVLRGYSSIGGNNQPLIVIDGVVIDNSSAQTSGATGGYGGFDYGNAAQDINPNNIKSVSVLKGPSAAALYGSRGANGVIQITTKDGSTTEGDLGVSYSTSVSVSQVYNYMNYQNKYGGGASGSAFTTLKGAKYRLDGEDDQYVASYATDESWGPRLDGRPVRQWYSWDDVNGLKGEATPWVAHPDAVKDFMQMGTVFNNNLAFSQKSEGYSYRLGLTSRNEEDVMPNGSMNRYQVNFNGTADLSDDITATAFGRYGYTSTTARSGSGYGFEENPFAAFNTFTQRQLDYGPDSYMRDYQRPNGQQRGWNYAGISGAQGPETQFQYTDNPYVNRYENYQSDDEQRFFGKAELEYNLTESLTGNYMVSTDHRTERRDDRRAELSTGAPSAYMEEIVEAQEINTELRVDYNEQLTDAIDVTAFGAGRVRYESYERNRGQTTNGLASPGTFTLENSRGRRNLTDYFEEKMVYSAYGSVNLGYDGLFYLEGTLRNDWSSALPEKNNSYLYPSISGNFIFTELEALTGQDVLSFGKIRASWARVGSDTSPYRLSTTFPLRTPFEGQPLQNVQRNLNNSNLKPERTTGIEVGADLEFFGNRVQLNTTYYRDVTRDQILSVGVSGGSGVDQYLVNAGKVSNRGLEASLTVTPIVTEDLKWDLTANFNKNVSKVEELAEGIDTYNLAPTVFGPAIEAREGAAYGAIVDPALRRDKDGDVVFTRNGIPRTTADPKVLGSFQPDWTGGLSTTFSYGNLTVSALVNGQMGGDVYSLSNKFGMYSGLLEGTVEDNQRETGIVPDGVVLPDGVSPENASEVDGIPFEEAVGRLSSATYWKNVFSAGGGSFHAAGRTFIYDATHARLQEVAISYQLPQKWFSGLPLRRASVGLTGNNLMFLYKEAPSIDPTATLGAGNVQGVEAAQIPPQRRYTVRLNLNF